MQTKNKLRSLALALSLPLSAAAAENKTVTEQATLAPSRQVRLDMDRGYLTVKPSAAGRLSYQVKFVPDETAPFLGFFGGTAPSTLDYAESTASYDPATGVLTVHTGKHLDAVVTLEVPAAQPLALRLGIGEAKIGPVTGRLEAAVEDGLLKYDASALPAGACVDASAKDGIVENKRDHKCEPASAVLRLGSGILSVK